MAPGDPGAPGFPGGPAGPGRLQTSWEEWMVMLRPLLGEEYVDWEKTTDSKQNITHIWSTMVTVESREDEAIVYNNSFVVSHSQMIQMPVEK